MRICEERARRARLERERPHVDRGAPPDATAEEASRRRSSPQYERTWRRENTLAISGESLCQQAVKHSK